MRRVVTALRRRAVGAAAGLILALAVPSAALANGWEHAAVPFQALLDALNFEDPTTRAQAARSLGFRGQTEALEPLRRALERPEDDPNVRSAIYAAFGGLGDARAVPVLAACLDSETRPELRGDCAAAVGQIAAPDGLPRLLRALDEDPSFLVRGRVVDALGGFSDRRAVAALADLVTDGRNRNLRQRAIRALGRTGSPAAAGPLLDALAQARNDGERIELVEALVPLGAATAVRPLARLLETAEAPALRVRIVAALGASRDGGAYASLVRMLDDADPAVRYYAVGGLRALGRAEAARPIAALATSIEDRLAALSDAQLFAEPVATLADLSLEVVALRALAELDPSEGLPALLRAARPRDLRRESAAALRVAGAIYERRRVAIYGLGYTAAAEAGALLLGPAGLGDPDPRLRAAAVRALGVLGRPDTPSRIVASLSDPVPEVRWTAAAVLGRLADQGAVAPLVARLGDSVAEVRKQAALSLAYLGDPGARAALEALVAREREAAVRDAAAFAVTRLRGAE